MPYCSRAILGNSRLSIFLAKRALWSDHSASEILKSPIGPGLGWPVTSAAEATRVPKVIIAPPATAPSRNWRRLTRASFIEKVSVSTVLGLELPDHDPPSLRGR